MMRDRQKYQTFKHTLFTNAEQTPAERRAKYQLLLKHDFVTQDARKYRDYEWTHICQILGVYNNVPHMFEVYQFCTGISLSEYHHYQQDLRFF